MLVQLQCILLRLLLVSFKLLIYLQLSVVSTVGQQGSGTITPLVVSVVIVALVLLVVVGLLILLLIFLYYQKRKGVKNKGPPTNDDTMYNNSLYDFRGQSKNICETIF